MPTVSRYSGAPDSADTGAYPSGALWNNMEGELNDPTVWIHCFEDFRNLPFTLPTTTAGFGHLQAFTSSGTTFAQDIADFSDGLPRKFIEATDNEGFVIGQGSQPFKIVQDAGELIFECRIKSDEITIASGLFVGLIEAITQSATVPIGADGEMTDNNYVGFVQDEGDPDAFDLEYTANGVTLVTLKGDAVTRTADTYVKVGMVFNRKGDNALRFYENGAEITGITAPTANGNWPIIPAAAGTDFPNDVPLGWCISALNGAASGVNVTPDWIRVAQRRVSKIEGTT